MKTYSVRACISLTLNKEHKNFSSLETAVVKENASYLLLFFFSVIERYNLRDGSLLLSSYNMTHSSELRTSINYERHE